MALHLVEEAVSEEPAINMENVDMSRPKTRGDCIDSARPCPFVGCKYHLYLDVNEENGSIKINFPDKEVWELDETCALDVADKGGTTLEQVGGIFNLTRERIRQVEVVATKKLEASHDADDLLPIIHDEND